MKPRKNKHYMTLDIGENGKVVHRKFATKEKYERFIAKLVQRQHDEWVQEWFPESSGPTVNF